MKKVPGSPDPLSEGELVAGWLGALDVPLVSICCTTYNHVDVIEDAFRGFLSQRTDFPFEVIVHDDASVDGTSDIVRRWASAYPRIVRAFRPDENQYSITGRTLANAVVHARGEFVALCEGDDYWISPTKLQQQIDALRDAASVELCLHTAWKVDVGTGRITELAKSARSTPLVSTEALVDRRHGQIPTASMTMTRRALDRYLDYRQTHELTVGDIYIAMFASSPGGAVMIPEPLSVYRNNRPGSWSGNYFADPTRRLAHARTQIRAHSALEPILAHVPPVAFRKARAKYAGAVVLGRHIRRRERLQRLLQLGRHLNRRQLRQSVREIVRPRL